VLVSPLGSAAPTPYVEPGFPPPTLPFLPSPADWQLAKTPAFAPNTRWAGEVASGDQDYRSISSRSFAVVVPEQPTETLAALHRTHDSRRGSRPDDQLVTQLSLLKTPSGCPGRRSAEKLATAPIAERDDDHTTGMRRCTGTQQGREVDVFRWPLFAVGGKPNRPSSGSLKDIDRPGPAASRTYS